MKTILAGIGWFASLFSAIIGIVFLVIGFKAYILLLVSLSVFVFSVCVNPTARRRIKLFHAPWIATSAASLSVILGISSLVGAIFHGRTVEMQEEAAQSAQEAQKEVAFRKFVMNAMPMDEQTFQQVRIASTMQLDVDDVEGVKKYLTAFLSLTGSGFDGPDQLKSSVNDTVNVILSRDSKGRVPNSTTNLFHNLNSTSPIVKAIKIIETMKANKALHQLSATNSVRDDDASANTVSPDSVKTHKISDNIRLSSNVVRYDQGCTDGKAQACYDLAVAFNDGESVRIDIPHAAILYRRACDGGISDGCYNLATLYDEGKGIPRDLAAAIMYYKKALTLDPNNKDANENLESIEKIKIN